MDAAIDAPADTRAAEDTAVPPPTPVCGNGKVKGADQCDDGNGANGDGCDNDCTFSCELAADCADENTCNGDELCSPERTCASGDPLFDGTPCGGTSTCRGGACAPPNCGDAVVQPPEDCDDDNLVEGDGCDNDCSFSCALALDCDDGEPCSVDACNLETHTCGVASVGADGDVCDRDMMDDTRDICIDGTCIPSICGDGFLDLGAEECDDGNREINDGCEPDCTFTCREASDCDDGNICNGREACDGICFPGDDLLDGTLCPLGMCSGGACTPVRLDGGTGGDCFGPGECPSGQFCCGSCSGSRGSCISIMFSCMDVCGDGGAPS